MHFLDCAPLSQEESSVCNSDLEFLCSPFACVDASALEVRKAWEAHTGTSSWRLGTHRGGWASPCRLGGAHHSSF